MCVRLAEGRRQVSKTMLFTNVEMSKTMSKLIRPMGPDDRRMERGRRSKTFSIYLSVLIDTYIHINTQPESFGIQVVELTFSQVIPAVAAVTGQATP